MTAQRESALRSVPARPDSCKHVDSADVLMALGPQDRVLMIDLSTHPRGQQILAAFAGISSRDGLDPLSSLAIADVIDRLCLLQETRSSAIVPVRELSAPHAPATRPPAGLSARELEVLGLIAQGCTNQEIAQRLFLSINSIKTYIRTAYRKIGITRRAQAVRWGLHEGLAGNGDS